MSELIRREDAIKATWQEPSYTDPLNVLTEVRDRIKALPTASRWHRVKDELPEPNIQCLVRDDDNNCAVGYYRQDARAWDSPFFGWVERDDEYYEDGDLCRIGKVVAWMPIPPQEDA